MWSYGARTFKISCVNWDTDRLITAPYDRAILTLNRIRETLLDDSLCDFECIEEIVCILEDSGIGCGSRHDF